MCTLSVLRRPAPAADDETPLFRVAFNRDERRTRPPAHPPQLHTYDGLDAVHPIDPLGGGTWIAASSAGLVFALLNGYADADDRPRAAVATSRGLIIPSLLNAATLDAATTRVQAIDPAAFLSFRLVMIDEEHAREAVSDGRHLECRDVLEGAAWLRSSSSVRPDVVLPHRGALFQHAVARSSSASAQDRFHLTPHTADPAMGVLMERSDARTVSVTTVEVFAARVRMTYRPIEPDARAATIALARQPR